MTLEVREYTTEGHRLLVEHALSPSEIAAKTGLNRQRVSQWRTGESRPTGDARRALEGVGIPARAWDAAPTSRPKAAPPPSPPPLTPEDVEAATGDELAGYGVAGLEATVDHLRTLAPGLPPKERVAAVMAEGRLHVALAGLQAKERDARVAYLRSAEFQGDMRLLAAGVPGTASELRDRLSRMGIELPSPPVEAATVNRAPPKNAPDVEGLLRELAKAAEWRTKGEPYLAAAHVMGLCIDVHANEIATVLADVPELAGRFLAHLEPADESIVSAALERRMAVADAAKLPSEARRSVVQLLEAHGLADVAAQIGAS